MMMKGLKWGIIGLLAGQAIGLFASKPALKKKLATAEGTDKVKVVFDELVNFNKGLIESVDLTKVKSDIAFRVEHLQEEINDLTNQWSGLNHDKLNQWIGYLKTTTETLKTDVISYVTDLDEKHQLTDKLGTLKEHISQLQSKLIDDTPSPTTHITPKTKSSTKTKKTAK